MSTPFDRTLYGWRYVSTFQGDTLQTVAARELGDATMWAQLVSINSLIYPYLTDDPTLAGSGVLLTVSDLIVVPAPVPAAVTATDPNLVFGSDVGLDKFGNLTVSNGDFGVVSGLANLSQGLSNALVTEMGELLFHGTYGSRVRSIVGASNGPTKGQLAATYAKQPVLADSRVASIASSTATVTGDAISVVVNAVTISGRPIAVAATL